MSTEFDELYASQVTTVIKEEYPDIDPELIPFIVKEARKRELDPLTKSQAIYNLNKEPSLNITLPVQEKKKMSSNFIKEIVTFTSNMKNADTWIRQFERAAKLDHISEEDRMDILLLKLDLTINEEIEKKNLKSYVEIINHLKAKYNNHMNVEYALRKLTTFTLRMDSVENLEASLSEVEKLIHEAHPDLDDKAKERETHAKIIQMIYRNQVLANAAGYSLGNRTVKELITEICTAYALNEMREKSNRSKNSQSKSKNVDICGFCHKANHHEKSSRVRCNVVSKSLNHDSLEVKHKQKSYKKRKPLKSSRSLGFNFIISIFIDNNTGLYAMLDTGAERSLIPYEVVEDLRINIEPVSITISCANKTKFKCLGEATIRIKIGPLFHNMTFLTVKKDDLVNDNYSCILGSDFLLQTKAILDFELKELTLKGCRIKINDNSNLYISTIMIEDDGPYNYEEDKLGKCIHESPVLYFKDDVPKFERYDVPISRQQAVHETIKSWLKNDVIHEVKFAKSILNLTTTPKPDGSIRTCVDSRPINPLLENFDYRVPNFKQVIHKLANSEWFSTIDIKQFFLQIPLPVQSQDLIGFRDPLDGSLYAFKRMPFGIKSATSICQRILDIILKGENNCIIYVDDILVHSPGTKEEHLKLVERIKQKLMKAGLVINEKKSTPASRETRYLGHPLKQLLQSKQPKHDSMARYILAINEYHPEIRYIEGKKNSVADALSRANICTLNIEGEEMESNVDNDEKQELFRTFHDELGHACPSRTLDLIRRRKRWKTLVKDLKLYIENCIQCKLHNSTKSKLLPFQTKNSRYPFETLGIDICGPFEKTKNNNIFILGTIDHLTRYVSFIPIVNQKSDTIINKLEENILLKFGNPTNIKTDNAQGFSSVKFRNWCKGNNINLIHSLPYIHESNSHIERAFKTMQLTLKKVIQQSDNWDNLLNKISFMINNTINTTTGYCPNELILGFRPLTRYDMNLSDEERINLSLNDLLPHVKHELAREVANATRQLLNCKANETRNDHPETFEINETVLVKNLTKKSKLDKEYLLGTIEKIVKDGKLYQVKIKGRDERGRKRQVPSTNLKKL
uniref:RNA-directed DNA polymerase n=1 Tax=Strongyloides stercoralis TaxID=6248 RepID=A0AAF5DM63_STRER